MPKITNDWAKVLAPEFKKPYYMNIYHTLVKEYQTRRVYPDSEDLLNAFHLTPYSKVKAVILGQDPYHNEGQAHGLAFSVQKGVEIPPSLVNIYQELHEDLGCPVPSHGNLTKWAEEGVLLLNTILTVRAHQAFSHRDIGWSTFTDEVIRLVDQKKEPVVFMLWGKPAQQKAALLSNPDHLVLKAPHPSPLSAYRGFFGCRHFSKANEYLKANGVDPIDWTIDD